MRVVPPEMTAAWKSQDKTGPNRPVIRATIQRFGLRRHRYDTSDQTMIPEDQIGNKLHVRGHLNSALFGDQGSIRELENVISFSWNRSTNQDVAEGTLVLQNTKLRPIGSSALAGHLNEYDALGALMPTRGQGANRWGYAETGWAGMVMPDRMIKTYEGYGSDPDVYPALDGHLKQSGVWIIDDVDFDADGNIEVKVRDLGRLLLDQIVFPPAVPAPCYPLSFSARKRVTVTHQVLSGGSWRVPAGTRVTSSNRLLVGQGIGTSDGTSYIEPDGSVDGHYPAHALSPKDSSKYWQSPGSSDRQDKHWLQFNFASPTNIAGIRFSSVLGPYRVYIHVQDANGKWLGRKQLAPSSVKLRKPLSEGGGYYPRVDMHTKLPFTRALVVGGDYMGDGGEYGDHGYVPDSLQDRTATTMVIGANSTGIVRAKAVRLTFSRLQRFAGQDDVHPYHAAIQGFEIYGGPISTLASTRTRVRVSQGNYKDWTDVVKWMLAWGGWFWPEEGTTENWWATSPTERNYVTPDEEDDTIPRGALWADIQKAGTGGVADLTVDQFDKRPFMDIIAEVRDTLGYLAFVDETGGYVFRMGNFWKKGNYLSPDALNARGRVHTTDLVTVDENETLLRWKVRLSSRNSREFIFVGDSTGHVGWTVRGYTGSAYGTNLGRVAGWTDKELKTVDEARVAADLIATQQMFRFRTATATIPGYPAIQIDDQVEFVERTTNESYVHYIESISSDLNMRDGTWIYNMNTHWLGEDTDADSEWAIHPDKLDEMTKAYLSEMGSL